MGPPQTEPPSNMPSLVLNIYYSWYTLTIFNSSKIYIWKSFSMHVPMLQLMLAYNLALVSCLKNSNNHSCNTNRVSHRCQTTVFSNKNIMLVLQKKNTRWVYQIAFGTDKSQYRHTSCLMLFFYYLLVSFWYVMVCFALLFFVFLFGL